MKTQDNYNHTTHTVLLFYGKFFLSIFKQLVVFTLNRVNQVLIEKLIKNWIGKKSLRQHIHTVFLTITHFQNVNTLTLFLLQYKKSIIFRYKLNALVLYSLNS